MLLIFKLVNTLFEFESVSIKFDDFIIKKKLSMS